jgi:hypothetical protein
MLPGPDIIYQCSTCSNLLKVGSLTSGNTFGATIFSDGKRIAPMLPDFPEITKCKKCNTIFWISKAKKVGSYHWGDRVKPEWANADNAEFLTLQDYSKALENNLAENEKEEVFIRQNIWWSFNDRVRDGYALFENENDKELWRKNCITLLDLFDEKDVNQKIMIAEINRNLGHFDICIAIIDSIVANDLDWLKEKFKDECSKKNRLVFPLT